MPHEGYADPVTNNEPGFHSDMPVSKLTERDTRAIEASDVNSTPPVAETVDRVRITKTSQPSIGPLLCTEAQGKLDSQGDRMRGRRMMARTQGRVYVQKLIITFLKPKKLSPTSFAIVSSTFSET